MASLIGWRNRDYKNQIDDITMGLDNLELSVMMKASAVSKVVKDATLGPNSKPVSYDDFYSGSHTSQNPTIRRTSTPLVKKAYPTKNYLSQVIKPNQLANNISTSSKKSADGIECQVVDESSRSLLKTINDLDLERQMIVREIVNERTRKMEEESRRRSLELQNKYQYQQRLAQARAMQEEEKILRQQEEEEIQASQRRQQIAQEHKQHAQRRNELNERIKEAEKQQKEAIEEENRRLKEKKLYIDKIYQCQMEYRNKCEQIAELAKHCKDRQTLIAKASGQVAKLKSLTEAMELFVKQCKIGEVNNQDHVAASAIVQQADAVLEFFRDICNNINEGLAAEAKRQEERKAEEEKQKSEAVEASKANNSSGELSEFVDKDSYQRYIYLQQLLQNHENSYETLLKDKRFKKFKFDCQKAVNIPINAISLTSASHLQDKLVRLSRLITGQPVDVMNEQVIATSVPEGITFCKNLIARKFVWQSEETVSNKPTAAFAIAAVMVSLWADYPDVGELILAHFYKLCPYLVPMYLPQVEGQSTEDYYKSLGYRYNEDGTVEKHDKFLKRMSGIMRLYAAVLISQPCRYQQNKTNPHGLAYAWRWISSFVNLDPQPDISATLLYDFLEVAGNAMYNHYGRQFQKLLHFTCKEYYPKIEKVTQVAASGGPMMRLEAFLQKILKDGHIPPPAGVVPPNFW